MTSIADRNPAAAAPPPSLGEQFLRTFIAEHATTRRVLSAFPPDQLTLRPHEKCKTARELAWIFVIEQAMAAKALTTGFDWSVPPTPMPAPPETMEEIIAAFDTSHQRVVDLVRGMGPEELQATIRFFTGPGTLGDVPRISFLWFLLHDQIHHRGQFSIYLRIAGARVPSIYGPTADEPWM